MKTIYFLSDDEWECGTVVGGGARNYTIHTPASGCRTELVRTVPRDKCAEPDECVCVVWEFWCGGNGRGGYRVERNLYAQHRLPAKQIARKSFGLGRVTEQTYGELK